MAEDEEASWSAHLATLRRCSPIHQEQPEIRDPRTLVADAWRAHWIHQDPPAALALFASCFRACLWSRTFVADLGSGLPHAETSGSRSGFPYEESPAAPAMTEDEARVVRAAVACGGAALVLRVMAEGAEGAGVYAVLAQGTAEGAKGPGVAADKDRSGEEAGASHLRDRVLIESALKTMERIFASEQIARRVLGRVARETPARLAIGLCIHRRHGRMARLLWHSIASTAASTPVPMVYDHLPSTPTLRSLPQSDPRRSARAQGGHLMSSIPSAANPKADGPLSEIQMASYAAIDAAVLCAIYTHAALVTSGYHRRQKSVDGMFARSGYFSSTARILLPNISSTDPALWLEALSRPVLSSHPMAAAYLAIMNTLQRGDAQGIPNRDPATKQTEPITHKSLHPHPLPSCKDLIHLGIASARGYGVFSPLMNAGEGEAENASNMQDSFPSCSSRFATALLLHAHQTDTKEWAEAAQRLAYCRWTDPDLSVHATSLPFSSEVPIQTQPNSRRPSAIPSISSSRRESQSRPNSNLTSLTQPHSQSLPQPNFSFLRRSSSQASSMLLSQSQTQRQDLATSAAAAASASAASTTSQLPSKLTPIPNGFHPHPKDAGGKQYLDKDSDLGPSVHPWQEADDAACSLLESIPDDPIALYTLAFRRLGLRPDPNALPRVVWKVEHEPYPDAPVLLARAAQAGHKEAQKLQESLYPMHASKMSN